MYGKKRKKQLFFWSNPKSDKEMHAYRKHTYLLLHFRPVKQAKKIIIKVGIGAIRATCNDVTIMTIMILFFHSTVDNE